MNNSPILFFDSGAGGLPYLDHFQKRNPLEELVYVADRRNFPYGSRGKDELEGLLIPLFARLLALYAPKLAVLACNTASVSVLEPLRRTFPRLPWVGTVPAVKPAVLRSKTGVIGVLGTARTIADPYIKTLAAKFRPDVRIHGIAAPRLVEFVEHELYASGPEERAGAVRPYLDAFREAGADGVVLGCTHFLSLLDDFKAEGKGLAVYDSLLGVSSRIEELLETRKLKTGRKEVPVSVCVLTGEEEPSCFWKEKAAALGLKLFSPDFSHPGSAPCETAPREAAPCEAVS